MCKHVFPSLLVAYTPLESQETEVGIKSIREMSFV